MSKQAVYQWRTVPQYWCRKLRGPAIGGSVSRRCAVTVAALRPARPSGAGCLRSRPWHWPLILTFGASVTAGNGACVTEGSAQVHVSLLRSKCWSTRFSASSPGTCVE